MARVIDEFPPGIARSARIDWARYADGQKHELTQGEDFPQEPEKARQAFLSWMHRHRKRGHSGVLDDKLYVQVTGDKDDAETTSGYLRRRDS